MPKDYAWIDHRWQNTHWLAAFRMRFCGWLPADIAAEAISRGLFLRMRESEEATVVLTEKACDLTDLSVQASGSTSNCIMLANVLVTKGFQKSWLTPGKHTDCTFLQTTQIFPKSFKDKILFEIESVEY